MTFAQAEAASVAAFLRNRTLDRANALDGALPVAGGYALFAAGTPVDRAIGVGAARPLQPADLAAIAAFYAARGVPAGLEIALPDLERDRAVLDAAGFRDEPGDLVDFASPLGRELPDGHAVVRPTRDRRRWVELGMQGFADVPGDPGLRRGGLELVAALAQALFVAALDGVDVGTGALAITGEYAVLLGGAVLPAHRGRRVHAALLAARLREGQRRGALRAGVKVRADSPAVQSLTQAGFTPAGLRRRLRAGALH